MAKETQKAVVRRLYDSRFIREYFVGNGIDIGAGEDSLNNYRTFFPGIESIRSWDVQDGDAQYLTGIEDNYFDFAISSHCLEHVLNPIIALKTWIRVLKPKGHLIITIPDEDMYEQRNWPSIYNPDHKCTFTILKHQSWCPKSINVTDLLSKCSSTIKVKKIELLDSLFDNSLNNIDQTRFSFSESAIEIVLQKL